MGRIEVRPGVSIPADEVRVTFARAGGPGGQHVNTSATKAQLRFDVERSAALSPDQKARIRDALGNRMTVDGELVLESAEHRSQVRNREAALARLCTLLDGALRPARPRRPTRKPRAATERRLAAKRTRSERKRLRKPPLD